MKSAFEMIDSIRTRLNLMEDDLTSIAHNYRSNAHDVESTLASLRQFRDALYELDRKFEEAKND